MNTGPERRSFVRLPREQRMQTLKRPRERSLHSMVFEAASINEIAGQAGVSEGSIYKFYTNKRDLLHTILKTWYEGMIAEFMAKLDGVVGTRARIHVVIWQHLKSIKESPDLCRLFFSEVRGAPDYYSTDLYDMNREYTRVLLEILKSGVKQGDIRPDVDHALVRDVIFGGIEHHVTPYLMGRGEFDLDTVAGHLSHMVYAGISAGESEKPEDFEALVKRLEDVADRLDRPSGKDR